MNISIQAQPDPLRVGEHGEIRIGNSRVLLEMVLSAFDDGETPEGIVQAYPSLELADVYAVIAYCLRHRAEVDAYLREREEYGDRVRRNLKTAAISMSNIRERLLKRIQVDRRTDASAGE